MSKLFIYRDLLKRKAGWINKYIGIDDSILWAIINKGFGIIRSPITIYFLIRFLSVQEQGLWYTFTSLGALTMLADLGFTSIITQFVSHEFAKLSICNGSISGDLNSVDRMMGLIKFSIRFYLKITLAAIIILTILGYWYFRRESFIIHLAWFFYSFVGAISLLVCLFQTIYQGLDKIKEIQINLLLNSFVVTSFLCLGLYFNLKIWSLITGYAVGVVMTALGLYLIAKPFWKQVFNYRVSGSYSFLKDTVSLQARYAVSFICSYIIGYLYIPATYKFVGSIAAGQLGMTISIVSVISSIANSWLFTKVPKFNICVSRRQYKELDNLFKRSIFQGLFIQIFLSFTFIITLIFINIYFVDFSKRFLNIKLSVLFLVPQVIQFIITGLTLYLRAFKKEPLMWLQIINAMLIIASTGFLLFNGLGLSTFFYSINAINWIVLLPLALVIFRRKRQEFILDKT